jgi:hypothetical protein
MRQIIDPRLRMAIPEVWQTTCIIQNGVTTLNAANQPVVTDYEDIPDMVNLQCRMAPFITLRPDDAQIRDQAVTENLSRRNLKLNSYRPAIKQDMFCLVDGDRYRIVGIEHDGSKFSTRLHLELIEP